MGAYRDNSDSIFFASAGVAAVYTTRPMRSIAEAIGKGVGVPSRSIPADQAAAHFDWMGMIAGSGPSRAPHRHG